MKNLITLFFIITLTSYSQDKIQQVEVVKTDTQIEEFSKQIGTKEFKKPFRVISLCDNNAIITAIGNDDGFEKIFSQQLEVLLQEKDVVVAISASGNSINLLNAFDVAKRKGATTVGLSAFDGGKLKEKADISVHVPTNKGEYGPAEDAHMVLDHMVSNYLIHFLKN